MPSRHLFDAEFAYSQSGKLEKEDRMIPFAKSTTVYVRDQQRAVDFWVNKMGFEKRTDLPMGPDARWIEVSPPGAQTVLVPYTPPWLESRIGTFSGIVFDCDDIQATYKELRRRGVEFTEEPTQQSWGLQAQFKDSEGNGYVLVQSKE